MSEHQGAISAAQEYLKGLKVRKQISQLTNTQLAKKFERPSKFIKAIEAGGYPGYVPESERRLILACIEERKRLEGIAKGYTAGAVTARFHVSRKTLQSYVEDWQEMAL